VEPKVLLPWGWSTEFIASLQGQIDWLRREVEAWREEARRKDTIIIGLVQWVPELEPVQDASSDAPGGHRTASEGQGSGKSHEEDTGPQKRSW
jgi:hypothetical protein